ncbi:MAG: radical SAM protein, partial [Desulfosarcina sp.]
LSTLPVSRVIDAVSWARDQGIAEVYLLDPCLNSRKDLHELLARLARINVGRQQVRLISEIRAESVDDRLADGFAQAGFTWFEIGLQSTTPAALQTMNRPTDLKAFLQGTRRLRERGIRMGVDLIVGLPGDDPVGFSRSVRFVGDNGLSDEVQVFPLSVLPGTQFRKRSIELGLLFETHPPYTVIETPAFSRQAIAESLDEAQAYFNLSLYPMPDLDLAGCSDHFIRYAGVRTCQATVSGVPIITKALINQHVDSTILDSWAVRLAHPYQIVIGPLVGEQDWIGAVVRQLTSINPFTPFEIVFVEPLRPPDTETILAAAQLRRPHYLDNDLAFLYPQPGNRAVLFSLLSASDRLTFQGAMQRQIRRWIHPTLPSSSQLEALDGFDGVFIPDSFDRSSVGAWQDALAPRCEMLPAITFADPAAQKRWMQLTQAGDYWLEALPDTCGP